MAGQKPVNPERRRSTRYPLRIPVTIKWMGRMCWSVTEDISLGGLFLQTFNPPQPGEKLEILLKPHNGQGVQIYRGTVTHRRERNKGSIPEQQTHRLPGVGVSLEQGAQALFARVGPLISETAHPLTESVPAKSTPRHSLNQENWGGIGDSDFERLEDPTRIEEILEELSRGFHEIRLERLGSGVRCSTYLRRVLRTASPLRVEADPVDLRQAGPLPSGATPLHLTFSLGDRCYTLRILEDPLVLSGVWSFEVPPVLYYRRERRHPRYALELRNPLTVEFTDPSDSARQRVKNVLDISYPGLSFKNYPGDELYVPGARIPEMMIFAFDHFCRRTGAVVKHASLVCRPSGEIYQSVGLEFLQSQEDIPLIPRIKEGELEEIKGDALILQHLVRLSREDVRFLAAAPKCVLFADGRVEVSRGEDSGSLTMHSSLLPLRAESPFRHGPVNYHYLLNGIYHFFSSRSRLENGFVRMELPLTIYKAKRRRSLRVKPDEVQDFFHFLHPMLGRRLSFPLRDLSVRGLSFEGDYAEHLLWKGFCLRGCEIGLSGELLPLGSVEVRSVSRTLNEEGKVESRCGVEFADLPARTGKLISAFIFGRSNPKIHPLTCEKIESLWQLFYQSGFIYPSKDAYIKKIKPEINRTWEKLLSAETSFYKNIVFRELDVELGTASAVQVYENTWMFQHLAATEHPVKLIPKYVLLGLAHFLMENQDIKFLITYFRKENSFPRKIYSGFLESYPQEEQLRFTRFHYLTREIDRQPGDPARQPVRESVPRGVYVEEASDRDKATIENYFHKSLHPLLIRSRSFYRDELHLPGTSALFLSKGLIRERHCLVAKDRANGILAFALLENSSPGINLSGLINTFSVWSVCGEAERIRQARGCLIEATARRYEEWGARTAIALTCEEDISDYLAAGFEKVKEYVCFTSSRTAIKSYYEYVQERFGRFEQRKQKSRSSEPACETPPD